MNKKKQNDSNNENEEREKDTDRTIYQLIYNFVLTYCWTQMWKSWAWTLNSASKCIPFRIKYSLIRFICTLSMLLRLSVGLVCVTFLVLWLYALVSGSKRKLLKTEMKYYSHFITKIKHQFAGISYIDLLWMNSRRKTFYHHSTSAIMRLWRYKKRQKTKIKQNKHAKKQFCFSFQHTHLLIKQQRRKTLSVFRNT